MPPKRVHQQHHHRPTLDEDPLPLPPKAPPHTFIPSSSRVLTEEEIAGGRDRLNQKTRIQRIALHPPHAIVEYPKTSDSPESRIAHIFPVDPDAFRNPLRNVQYSLDNCGQDNAVKCRLIVDESTDDPHERYALCYKISSSCEGIKFCDFRGPEQSLPNSPHSFVIPSEVTHSSHISGPPPAHREAFEKTFALFCSIKLEGCAAQPLAAGRATSDDGTSVSDSEPASPTGSEQQESSTEPREGLDATEPAKAVDRVEEVADPRESLRPTRSKRALGCRGQIIAQKEKISGKTFLCCEFWKPGSDNQYHFLLRSLHEHDFDYLCALIEGSEEVVKEKEVAAQNLGYGPLVSCNHVGEVRQVSERCLFWHRNNISGSLAPGRMIRSKPDCKSKLDTFIPLDLKRFPFVVIVAYGIHNHPPPRRTKTPLIFVDFLRSLLLEEGWKIADATPRRLINDGAFVARLRNILGWTAMANPSLADLHPSLANLDHVSWLIKEVQRVHFPDGTDWAGAQRLYNTQLNSVSRLEQYVRHVEERKFRGSSKPFKLIVCGFPGQFKLMVRAQWPAIDTSFKRVKNWMEFGMEFWDSVTNRSVSVCRAFINSQSADAHEHLFQVIDGIFERDVGRPLEFHHIHGRGIQVITVDEHKGQALGLGRYLVWKSRSITTPDLAEPSKRICDLQPYEHLERALRLCIVHYKRGIIALEKSRAVEPHIIAAMYSLASTEPLQDFEGTKRLISGGGSKAKNWLQDKLVSAPFSLPALYHPLSKIPREHWIAAKSSTNGIEQTHHNLNLDGVGLTLIGGIMRGYHYDARAISLNILTLEHSMYPKYKPATHLNRSQVSLQRRATATKKRATTHSTNRSQENSPQKKKTRVAAVQPPLVPSKEGTAAEPMTSEDHAPNEDTPSAATDLPQDDAVSPPTEAPPAAAAAPYATSVAPSTLNPPPPSLQPAGSSVFMVPPGYYIAYVPFMLPIPSPSHFNPGGHGPNPSN